MNQLDILIQTYLQTIPTPFVTEFLFVMTAFFDVTTHASFFKFSVLVLCVAVLIYLIRNKRYSFLFVFSLILGAVVTYILKYVFDVGRPLNGIISVSGQSFPSYHATISTVFFIMLMYIFDPVVDFSTASSKQGKAGAKIHYRADNHMGSIKRVVFNTFCVISIILVSVSRLYLGVHWLSDILGGIVLGVLVSYFSVYIYKKLIKKG